MFILTTNVNPSLLVYRDGKIVARFTPIKTVFGEHELRHGEFQTKNEELAVWIKKNCKHAQIKLQRMSDVKLPMLEDSDDAPVTKPKQRVKKLTRRPI